MSSRLLASLVRVRDRTGVGRAQAEALCNVAHRDLVGPAAGYGIPHWGAKGSPYEGGANTMLAASPQQFVGAAQMGASYNTSVQEYPGLPRDHAPAALGQWVQDWDNLEGVV